MTGLPELVQAAVDSPVTTGAIGYGGYALHRALGPTIDAIGEALGDLTSYRARNLLKLGDKLQSREQADDPGSAKADDDVGVHPKSAAQILEAASWSDDDVSQQYYAGLLLGARNPGAEEGDSAYYAGIVRSLSATHLRLHHVVYAGLVGLGSAGNELRTLAGAAQLGVYGDLADVRDQVGRADTAAQALHHEGLIGEYAHDPVGNLLQPWQPWAPNNGVGFFARPTTMGASLFLRAYNLSDTNNNALLDLAELPDLGDPMPVLTRPAYAPHIKPPA